MIAFEGMLLGPALAAGIKIPDEKKYHMGDFDHEEFPHWQVFIAMQLGRRLPSPNAHFANAELIAKIPDDKILTVTKNELLDMGYL